MDLHYNAFISYKHAPADIAVAKEIQHRLEHYHVPKAVREQTGRDRIERIFRDQEELPITSDLSKDIDAALKDAEYLIVICSTSTKLSTWVPREIARFLEFHDRNHVLTVLVDGEPNEVIPKILLEETTLETDESGTEQTFTRVYEPLSCDYRGSFRQARKTELPRLAAALLGCRYDELVMRERQYKLRRLTALASVGGVLAAAAIAYLIWSNRQIQSNYERAEENRVLAETNYQKAEENRQLAEENYQKAEENRQLAEENFERAEANFREAQANLLQARRNQITLLANEAINARNKENRILAAQLALAALPGEGREDWPRMALAEYALTRTIDAYTPFYSGASYSAVWEMEMRGNIQSFKVQRAKSLLYVYDFYGEIGAWSLTDFRELFRVTPGEDVDNIYVCDHDGKTDLLVDYEESLVMLDGTSGEVKWRFEAGQFGNGKSAYCKVFVFNEELYAFVDYLQPLPGGWDSEWRLLICRLDPETGKILWQSDYKKIETTRNYHAVLCEEENALYFCYASHTEGLLFCCDLASGKIREIGTEISFQTVAYLSKPEDGRIILYGVEEGEAHAGSYYLLGTTVLVTRRASLLSLNTESGETVWRSGFESSELQYLEDARSSGTLDHTDALGQTHKLLMIVFGRNVYFFDREDGSLYEECTLNAAPVSVNTYVSGQGFVSVLRNGDLISYQIGQDSQHASQLILTDTVYQAMLCFPHEDRISYVAKTERTKLQLFDMSYDDGAQLFEGAGDYGYFSGIRLFNDRYFAVCKRPDSDGPWIIDLFDLESKARILHREENLSGYGVTVLGMDPTGRWLLVSQNWPYQILAFDVKQEEEPRCFDVSQETGASFRECRMIGDRVCILQYGASLGQLLLVKVQEDGSLTQEARLPFSGVSGGTSVKFGGADDDGRFVCLVQYESGSSESEIRPAVLVCDLETGSWFVSDFRPEATAVSLDYLPSQELFAFADRKTLAVFGREGTLLYTAADPSRTVEAFHFCPAAKSGLDEDLLLVVTRDEDYRMDRYRASDGSFLGSTDITSYNSDITESRWTFAEGEIVLWLDDVINFIDTAEWICTAAAPQCLAYSASYRTLVSLEYRNAYRPVWYQRYSPEELIRKGKEFLKGLEMSDSVKSIYGIP
ncbi:MAG: TIR domain-containing protein [Lachnospiraceae bacterium]|nr:TIR domain-containing protein [Lachnospiraceae bacterium]